MIFKFEFELTNYFFDVVVVVDTALGVVVGDDLIGLTVRGEARLSAVVAGFVSNVGSLGTASTLGF